MTQPSPRVQNLVSYSGSFTEPMEIKKIPLAQNLIRIFIARIIKVNERNGQTETRKNFHKHRHGGETVTNEKRMFKLPNLTEIVKEKIIERIIKRLLIFKKMSSSTKKNLLHIHNKEIIFMLK